MEILREEPTKNSLAVICSLFIELAREQPAKISLAVVHRKEAATTRTKNKRFKFNEQKLKTTVLVSKKKLSQKIDCLLARSARAFYILIVTSVSLTSAMNRVKLSDHFNHLEIILFCTEKFSNNLFPVKKG